jgi:hypothetical protein
MKTTTRHASCNVTDERASERICKRIVTLPAGNHAQALKPELAPADKMAWYMYPEPKGTPYSREDLENERTVETIFDYCQVLRATILAPGWRHLFKTYGMSGILRINQRSGWYDEDCAKESFIDTARQCGYDPIADVFGTYEELTQLFLADQA